MVKSIAALPVDAILPEILESLRRSPNLVIEAPPGAGKTTRVPPALLELISGEVVVLEPRRIAARLAARRVAWEIDEPVPGGVWLQCTYGRDALSLSRQLTTAPRSCVAKYGKEQASQPRHIEFSCR